MGKAEKTIELFEKAIAANWLDSFRNGNLIEFPARGELMFTGDLHGAMENFDGLVETADLDRFPDRHLIIQEVVHQLEIGRDESYLLLEKTAALKVEYPDRVHVIMGNHDLAEVQGREIFKGGICLNLLFETSLEQAYGRMKDKVKEKYIEFIKTMPLAGVTNNRIFIAHSTPEGDDAEEFSLDFFRRSPEPSDFLQHSLLEKLLWGRDYSRKSADAFASAVGAEIFLVGHAPCTYGFNVPNHRHIILDSKDQFATYVIFSLEEIHSLEDMKARIKFLRPAPKAVKKGKN